MSALSLQTGLLLGMLLGMRHALEPDHLAAVSTLVTRHRSPRAGMWVGALWGIGHTLSLLGVGLVLGVLHTELPEALANTFELGVAVMLVALGVRAVIRALALGGAGPSITHVHNGMTHVHRSGGQHVHVGHLTLARQPLYVGLVHGLAGSGALTALALANMPSMLGRGLFMALFGFGSVLGMAFLTGLAGVPLSRIAKHGSLSRALAGATGLFSVLFGVYWGYPIAQGFLQ